MRISIYLSAALLLVVFAAVLRGVLVVESGRFTSPSDSHRQDLEYLKSVNTVAPPSDPQLLFLLMTQYANANMQSEGVEFFSARLKEFGPGLTDIQKALYLSVVGLLRAQHAPAVSLLHRVGYVKDTIAMLDQAKQLSRGQIFVVNWIAGIVHAQLPSFFHQRKAAQDELAWCVENVDKAPHAGWLREVYYHLGKLALAESEQVKAQDYLRRSGYADFNRPITLATPFSEDLVSGHTFSRGALLRSCRAGYTRSPVSSSRNTILWSRTMGESLSASTPVRGRTPPRPPMRRCERMHLAFRN